MSPSSIIQPVRCKQCGKEFARHGPLDLTKTENERTHSFIQVLLAHLQERHPEFAQAGVLLGREYAGMLHLMNFDISGQVHEQREYLRLKVHTITRRIYVEQERLEERVHEMLTQFQTTEEIERSMNAGGIGRAMVELMRNLRDVIMEANAPYRFDDNPYYTGPKTPELAPIDRK
jgi:hypothetical protein